ncbi:MAG TPA: ComEC/Rec2 family competence protein [Phycisphaerae bacterium]|nr:ComEC/Rec2 family competence protein [Phycisphaerae bacterium]HRY68338.1 ComEC/Rec2 family competence protein [Phycisphaerae bacterium]HSA26779.1 ComEC/Rec2 family competence protein [Phycisphaerae bacterium]
MSFQVYEVSDSTLDGADPCPRPLRSRRELLQEWLAAQPLLPPALGFILGIVLDSRWAVPFPILIAAFVLAGMALIRFRHRDGVRCWAVLLAGLAVGAARHDIGFRHWRADHVACFCSGEPAPVRLIGTVVSPPLVKSPDSGRVRWMELKPCTHMNIMAERIASEKGEIPASGLVAVLVREPVEHVVAGDRVELCGQLRRIVPPSNPGEYDFALAGRRRGILAQLACKRAAHVAVLSKEANRHWAIAEMRRRVQAAMLEGTFRGDEPGAELLAAMVLGQRSAVSPEINEAFTVTGTVHILSVSGSHVAMLLGLVWLVGMAVGASRRSCAVWAMVLITAYGVVAEPQPPIWRAMLMGNLLCGAILLRRPARTLNWMALAALVLLALQPTQLFDIGFQLSFMTVIGIMYLYHPVIRLGRSCVDWVLRRDDPLLLPEIQDRISPPGRLRRVRRWAVRTMGSCLAVSFVAWLAGLLPAAHHFHRVATWGWLSNLPVLPLVGVVEILGLVKAVLGLVLSPVSDVLGYPLALLTGWLIALVKWLASWPGAGLATPAVPVWLVCGGTGVLALWALRPWLRIGRRWVAACGLVFAVVLVWQLAPRRPGNECRVHVLAVGNGLASLLQLPDGRVLVCDVGARPPYDVERYKLAPLLARENIWRIDAALISHPNLDHFCGVPDLVARRRVDRVVLSPGFALPGTKNGAGLRLIEELRRRGVSIETVTRGDRLAGAGGAVMEVLWPPKNDRVDLQKANDTSLVWRLTCGGKRVLFCGDIEELPQRHLIASEGLKADVLILPHHGSVNETTAAFIEAVDPTYCIRSTGQRDGETRNGLLQLVAGRKYFNTAEDGAIEIRMTAAELKVSSFRRRALPGSSTVDRRAE